MNETRTAAGCLAVLLTIGSIFGIPVHVQASVPEAANTGNVSGKTHDSHSVPKMQTVLYPVDEITYAQTDSQDFNLSDVPTGHSRDTHSNGQSNRISIKSAKSADSYDLNASAWSDSGSDYYFSLLNTNEKKLYLNLKIQADCYLTGTNNFESTQVQRDGARVNVSILPMVSYDGLSVEQMKKVFNCFLFENPQYYFMRNAVIYSDSSKRMSVGLYEAFANGKKRTSYTTQFAQQIEIWEQQIRLKATPVEKEYLIHQIVCAHVSYNEQMAVDDPDDIEMSQSCISAVLFKRSTVCAGYAQLFSLLCNRAGIQCITVTSAGHAWNKVRMGSIWYNVDCTWDDCRSDETYLNVPDALLQAHDTSLSEHAMSKEWEGLVPPCTEQFSLNAANGADIAANVLTPGKPKGITVTSSQNKLSISFQPLEGCDGYTVQYASDAAMGVSKMKDIEKTSCAITGLKTGKVYYVRVRAYALDSNGNKLYGAFSSKLKKSAK